MYIKVVTTITTEIDVETMQPKHSVDIDSDSPVASIVLAAAAGATKSAATFIEGLIEQQASGELTVEPTLVSGNESI